MSAGNMPPQAYTKETLTKAFHWLQSQPEQVRENVKTPDALVALFMKAHRGNKIWEVDAPQSSRSFKDELRSLAQEVKHFEDRSVSPETGFSSSTYSFTAAASGSPNGSPSPANQTSSLNMSSPLSGETSFTLQAPAHLVGSLDERSRQYLKLVKDRLNLGSEHEALRVLITLGFEKLRSVLPEISG